MCVVSRGLTVVPLHYRDTIAQESGRRGRIINASEVVAGVRIQVHSDLAAHLAVASGLQV